MGKDQYLDQLNSESELPILRKALGYYASKKRFNRAMRIIKAMTKFPPALLCKFPELKYFAKRVQPQFLQKLDGDTVFQFMLTLFEASSQVPLLDNTWIANCIERMLRQGIALTIPNLEELLKLSNSTTQVSREQQLFYRVLLCRLLLKKGDRVKATEEWNKLIPWLQTSHLYYEIEDLLSEFSLVSNSQESLVKVVGACDIVGPRGTYFLILGSEDVFCSSLHDASALSPWYDHFVQSVWDSWQVSIQGEAVFHIRLQSSQGLKVTKVVQYDHHRAPSFLESIYSALNMAWTNSEPFPMDTTTNLRLSFRSTVLADPQEQHLCLFCNQFFQDGQRGSVEQGCKDCVFQLERKIESRIPLNKLTRSQENLVAKLYERWARRLSLRFVNIVTAKVNQKQLKSLPQAVIKQFRILPVETDGDELIFLATTEPSNIEDVKLYSIICECFGYGKSIIFLICDPYSFSRKLDELFGHCQ